MTLLFRVLYATHANGTHHKLALDALNKLHSPRADDWRRMFLKHAELYMKGSKAPDKEFKDFRNHVLHPGDNYWGGAPEKARGWYTHLVQALKDENWSEAVWCAGVLSHYYTDPIHPFHTAQSDAESAIHRAVEWSINKSYNDLYALGLDGAPDLEIDVPVGDTWVEDFVCQGADHSNQHYERLIAHYDINVGASDPPAGLDTIARTLIGGLLIYASTGFAHILDRAIKEADVKPPKTNLSLDTVLATLKIPLKWVLRKMDDATERATVEAIYDELMATGRVDKNLPADDRTIRDLHAKEVRAPRNQKRAQARANRTSKKAKRAIPRGLSALSTRPTQKLDAPKFANTGTSPGTQAPQPTSVKPSPPKSENNHAHRPTQRVYLKRSDPIEAAPVIGPKTATRLEPAGLITVDDLLKADPQAVAKQLSNRYITEKTISDWQDIARLVIDVPGLRGTHAQLLAGAGFRTRQSLADADPAQLSASVLAFAVSKPGTRILRDGAPPDIEKIKSWIENAVPAQAA